MVGGGDTGGFPPRGRWWGSRMEINVFVFKVNVFVSEFELFVFKVNVFVSEFDLFVFGSNGNGERAAWWGEGTRGDSPHGGGGGVRGWPLISNGKGERSALSFKQISVKGKKCLQGSF